LLSSCACLDFFLPAALAEVMKSIVVPMVDMFKDQNSNAHHSAVNALCEFSKQGECFVVSLCMF
jgi:hypothetical protein